MPNVAMILVAGTLALSGGVVRPGPVAAADCGSLQGLLSSARDQLQRAATAPDTGVLKSAMDGAEAALARAETAARECDCAAARFELTGAVAAAHRAGTATAANEQQAQLQATISSYNAAMVGTNRCAAPG